MSEFGPSSGIGITGVGDAENRLGAFADDDSVVSSNVTNEEAQTLTRGGLDMDSAENNRAGIMPRNRREWCIVIFALLLIVAAAAGTGIGLGFYFMNQGKTDPIGGTKGNGSDGNDGEESNDSELSETVTTPENATSVPPEMELPTDFAGAVEYHMISQGISDFASFADMAANGSSSGSSTPQQQARDWLVFDDVVQGKQDQPPPTDDLFSSQSSSSSYLDSTTPAYRVAQRFALASFYFATKGDVWDPNMQWLQPGKHECDYPGVTCKNMTIPSISLEEALQNPNKLPHHTDGSVDTTTERMIVEIHLPENNLQGTLPDEIMAFPFLTQLGLWSNNIEGNIPAKIGQLENLESLLLDDNKFTGGITTEIGLLKNLKMLSLGFNPGIGGGIPDELGSLTNLEALYLPNMSLRGALPSSMQDLENLRELKLQSNKLRGRIPDWLGSLVNLEKVDLSDNSFSGDVPGVLSALVNLRELELHGNDLGLIPCQSLEQVKLLSANCKSGDGTSSCDCCTSCV